MKSKKVTLGEIGETPRKEYVYNANDPTDKYIYNSSPERPKTSRKQSHPSPDLMMDYVKKSPVPKSHQRSLDGSIPNEIHIIHMENNSNSNHNSSSNTTAKQNKYKDIYGDDNNTTSEDKDTTIVGINNDAVKTIEYDEIIQLGCWLFGAGLKV